AAEASRRFAALASDPKSLDGPLKTTWLGIVAGNATAAEWDRLAELARTAPSAGERQAYFTLLGRAKDPARTQKALDFALAGGAGTRGAAIIAAVSAPNPDLAFDFALANRARVEGLVDSSGRVGYLAGLAAASHEPAMIGKLEGLRATVPADEQREVDRRIVGVRHCHALDPRLAHEGDVWPAAR